MMGAALEVVRSVEPAERPGRDHPLTLASASEIIGLMQQLAERRFCGEISLRGEGAIFISFFEGAVVWVRSEGYCEHLGDVLRRECGLSISVLERVIAHCKANKLHFGDGLAQLGLVDQPQLRDCLQRHFTTQLCELLSWSGELSGQLRPLPHRYDHALTFTAEELLVAPCMLTAAEWEHLEAIVEGCRERLMRLLVVAVADAQTGEMLCSGSEHHDDTESLLSLCAAGVQRLANNRVTGGDGLASDVAVTAGKHCVLVHRLSAGPWLLVLAGPYGLGALLGAAQSADLPLPNLLAS
ncbi:MAG: hypothetical protein KDK70_05655 [Myxococcales bacterium]|nr:hypothetical protein [Myxococcales bacterium]